MRESQQSQRENNKREAKQRETESKAERKEGRKEAGTQLHWPSVRSDTMLTQVQFRSVAREFSSSVNFEADSS